MNNEISQASERAALGVQEAPIEGRVAEILNERDLVINVGARQGVVLGMIFRVLGNAPREIRDPVSQEVIDVLDLEKIRVRATYVKDHIAICGTYRTVTTGPFLSVQSIVSLFEALPSKTETLHARPTLEPLSEAESLVKIGDRVISMPNATS